MFGLLVFMVLFQGPLGCRKMFVVGHQFDYRPDIIEKGKTTQEEVLSKFGRPVLVANSGDNVIHIFSYSMGINEHYELGMVVVLYDNKETVKDYYAGFQSTTAYLAEDKKEFEYANMSEKSFEVVADLLKSEDPEIKLNALTMAQEQWSPSLLIFLYDYLEKQTAVETNKKLLVMYYLSLAKMAKEQDLDKEEKEHIESFLTLIHENPHILDDYNRDNKVALTLILKFINEKVNNCDHRVLNVIYTKIPHKNYRPLVKFSAEKVFDEKTECVLEYFMEAESLDLEKTLDLIKFKKDKNDKTYLKLHYYACENHKEFGEISKKILEIVD